MKNSKAAYIVIDTNVLISAAILPKSKIGTLLEIIVERFVIAQNESTFAELESRIQRDKFDRYFGDNGRIVFLTRLAQAIEHFPINTQIQISRDADDDKFIGLAMDSGAKILISGDLDLKDIKTYKGIEILSPAQFMGRFKPK
jgi:putative PIN family toxin of toxin-antitoxin system